MSANPLPPWRRGDPLAADRFNAMQAAMVTDVIAGPGLRGIRGGGSVSLSLVPQAGGGAMSLVLVQNTTGAALPPFSVLGLGDPSCTPTQSAQGFREQLVLKGVTPTAADHGDKFVICEESFGVNAVLPCVLTGAARVQVNVTDASHTWAAVKDGDSTQLESAASGPARILWKESGTGVKWAVVQLGAAPPRLFPVKVTKDGGADGSKTNSATWTYTVKTLDDVTLGTSVPLARDRPSGKMTYGDGYGVAFFDDDELKLWDAGEIPDTGTCE